MPESGSQHLYGRATATYPVVDYSEDEVTAILEAAKERKRGEIANARLKTETSGTSGIKTDRESQALITGAALAAFADPDYTCQWKTEAGFVSLDSVQIKAVAQAVRAHVQSCFDREADWVRQIKDAETPEELDEIFF